jgi:hypothetical protein
MPDWIAAGRDTLRLHTQGGVPSSLGSSPEAVPGQEKGHPDPPEDTDGTVSETIGSVTLEHRPGREIGQIWPHTDTSFPDTAHEAPAGGLAPGIHIASEQFARALAQLVRDRWAAEQRGAIDDRGSLRVLVTL